MQKTTFGLRFGALAPKIKIQLKEQGYSIGTTDAARLQKLADSVVMLKIHGFLSDSASDVVRKKILKAIVKAVKPKKS